MWRTAALFIAGCVVFPIAVVAVLLMPKQGEERWRPMPPPR